MGVYMYLLHTMYILLQGCAKGKHNPVKPVEPVKPKTKPLAVGEVSVMVLQFNMGCKVHIMMNCVVVANGRSYMYHIFSRVSTHERL